MPYSQAFLAARAAEHRQRLITYLPTPEPIALPLACGKVVRVPQVHATPRIELELRLVGNPFYVGGRATRADVFRYLWRHHPRFLRPDGALPNQGHRRASWLDSMLSCASRLRLAVWCGRLAWPAAVACVRVRMDIARQDDPAADAESIPAPAAPPHCEIDDLCRHFAGKGMSRDAVLDSPVPYLLQFFRATLLAQPDGEMEVIDPSDALLGATADPTLSSQPSALS